MDNKYNRIQFKVQDICNLKTYGIRVHGPFEMSVENGTIYIKVKNEYQLNYLIDALKEVKHQMINGRI